jgi:hypothetical protein
MPHLGEGRAERHHDGGRNAEASGVIGDALGMIARRHGDDAARAFFRRQRQQLGEGAAFLERGGELKILEFEPDLATGDVRQGARDAQGRMLNDAFDGARGRPHIVDGEWQHREPSLLNAPRDMAPMAP